MNVAGEGGGGRTGPYWRRQMGTTLPGERTQEQLNMVNFLRQKAGLAPLGGQRTAFPKGQGARGVRDMLPPDALDRRRRAFPMPGPALEGGPTKIGPHDVVLDDPMDEPKYIPEHDGGYLGPQRGALPQERDIAGLRARLLNSVMGQQAPVGRDSLRQFVAQANMRRAQPGRAKPILPQRPPLRQAVARHPY